jgi:hypothetical protein
VVTALRRKYAELKGLGDKAAMRHVGATLLLFNPSEDLAAIPGVRPHRTDRDRWLRTAFTVLRKEARPMSGREIAYRVMEALSLDPSDYGCLKRIECSLYGVLGRLEGDGIRREAGRPKRWVLVGESVRE